MRKKETAAPLSPQFVAPLNKREPPAPPAIAIPETDVSGVWMMPAGNSVDSTSAQDRANAFITRNKPMYFAIGMFALGAALVWTALTMPFGIGMPLGLDKILVFAVVMSSVLTWLHLRASKLDYDHSEAGIKRLQIEKAYDYATEQLRSRERITAMAYKQLTEGEDDDESGS